MSLVSLKSDVIMWPKREKLSTVTLFLLWPWLRLRQAVNVATWLYLRRPLP